MGHRERRHIERISAAQGLINTLLTALESTLHKPLTGTDAAWHQRLRSQLRPLIDGLNQHRAFAEGEGGIFAEIEVTQGHGHELTTARRLHRSAVRQAEELFDLLGRPIRGLSQDEIRARGRRLGSAIRRHHALEADLAVLVFDQDTGTGD